jgi:hypothetical protein
VRVAWFVQSEHVSLHRARALLIEEMGIEPADELQKLERAIPNRDKNLKSSSGAPPHRYF